MSLRNLAPSSLHPPFGRYSHGIEIPAGGRVLRSSGQLGIDVNGTIPTDARAQAELCFANIAAILKEGGMGPENVAQVSGWVTDRAYMAGYMAARDAFFCNTPQVPASTLMIVSGFTREEFLVEVEVMAAAP